jgi:molybdopterin/thiamine biosynthesis adenylyltransferase
MALSPAELQRYARHILLKEIGGPGQEALRAARVLVIGAGGLGAPALMYLAAAGVGTLGVIDDDRVALSNLQRQIIHDTAAVGELKTMSAARSLARINPHVSVEQHPVRLDAHNALAIIARYDLVVDGCDNFATRFLVSDACFLAKKTLVSGAVGQFDGQISTFKPHLSGPDGHKLPTYRCLHPVAPEPGSVPTCEEAGIVGALTGIIGSMQALEAIKEITGAGDSLAGRVLMYDGLSARFMSIRLNRDPANPLNGDNPTIHDLSAHATEG